MKTSIIVYALLVIASIDAAPNLRYTTHDYCQNRGEACTKLKRAADAAAEALASPNPQIADDNYCQLQGQACNEAKRRALALAEVTANAFSAVESDANSCYAANGECNLAKRQAIEQAASLSTGYGKPIDGELEKRSDGKFPLSL